MRQFYNWPTRPTPAIVFLRICISEIKRVTRFSREEKVGRRNRCCSDVLLYNQIQLRHKNEKESCHKKKKKKKRGR